MIKNILKQIYLHIEEWVSVVFITVALILLTLQVILRFVFNTSFGWIEELSRYLYIWVIYLASSAAVKHDATIRIDVAENLWPKPIRGAVVALGKLIMLVFTSYITFYSAKYLQVQIANAALTPTMRIPMWIPIAILPIGSAFISIRTLIDFIESAFLHRKLIECDEGNSKEVRD